MNDDQLAFFRQKIYEDDWDGSDAPVLSFGSTSDISDIETTPPSFWELTKAHFKDNPLRWTYLKLKNKLSGSYEDPEFQITPDDVAGYEDFPQIMNAKNSIELLQYKELADDIKLQRRVMAEHGTGANIAAGLVAGLVDPINIATGFAGAGLVNAGFRIFRIAKKVRGVTKAVATGVVSAPLDIAVRSSLEERETDTSEYVIGASVSGLMGAAFGVAPSVVRSLNPLQKKRVREAFTQYQEVLTKPLNLQTGEPVSEIADTHIANALGVQKLAGKVAPNVTLANSEFNTAKEFGARMSPYGFKIENQAGEAVAQGATVEMLSQQAIAVDLKTFDGVIQRCFKDWLSESKGYGWCKSTFTNWASYNLWSGKLWEQFCDGVIRQLEFPDTLVEKPIQAAAAFFNGSVNALTDKAVKAGVFNENFEALLKKLKTEQQGLRRHVDRYNQAVADMDAVDALRGDVLADVYSKSEQLRGEVERLEGGLTRVDALLKNNQTTLSEVRAEIRKNETSAERANKSVLLGTGKQKGISETERFTSKVASKHENTRAGLATMKEDAELTLRFEKDTLKLTRQERPLLNKARAQLRTAVNENRKKLNSLYKGLMDEVEAFLKDAPETDKGLQEVLLTHSEAIREISSKINTLDRVRRGKMTKRDRKKEFSQDVKSINDDIEQLRGQIAENLAALKKANIELPPKIARYIDMIEDQTAWTERIKTELKTTEQILRELHKIQNYDVGRIMASGNKLQKLYERLDDKNKIIEKLTPRFVVRNRIKKTLTGIKEHYLERITELKKDANELSKIHTQLRNSQKETLITREKLSREAPTKEQLDRLAYLEKRLTDPKFTIADISNIKDPFYFPRVYNLRKIQKNRGEFSEILIKAYRAEGDQSSEETLRKSVNDTVDTLLHVVKAGGENKRGQRRFELSRQIDIPTHYLNDYLVKDLRLLYSRLVTTLEPDIYISKAFGTLNFEQILGKLKEEKDRKLLLAYGDNARQQAITEAYQTVAKDMETIWNRVRGEPRALEEQWSGFFRWCKNWNVMTKLGKLPLAILYDPFNMQLHVGLGRIGRQTVKLLNAKRVFGEDIENADIWIHGFTAIEDARYADLGDALSAGGRAGRFTGALANTFIKATGAPFIDEQVRGIVGHTKLEYFIRNCLKIANGKKVRKEVTEDLRKFGINKEMELRIAEEFQKHGEIKKGVYLAHADNWDEAVGDVLKSAVRKAQTLAILTPTAGSLPKGFDSVYWSTVLQFKRCMFAALSNVAVPFAQEIHDRRIGRVAKCLTAGYVGIYLKELASDAITGRERTHEEIENSVWKSFDALSVGTYLFNIADLYDTEKSDYGFGEKQVINLLGPTAGLGVDFWNAGRGGVDVMNGESLSTYQKRAIKRLIPFNNFLFLEKVVNSLFGIEYKDRTPRQHYIAE